MQFVGPEVGGGVSLRADWYEVLWHSDLSEGYCFPLEKMKWSEMLLSSQVADYRGEIISKNESS